MPEPSSSAALCLAIKDTRAVGLGLGVLEIRGIVEGKAGALLTIGGLTVKVDAQTVIADLEGRLRALADLEFARRVEVKGEKQPDDTLLALRIEAEMGQGQDNNGLQGTITAMTSSSVTVRSTPISVNPLTVVVDHAGGLLNLSALQVGQSVGATCTRPPDGNLSAIRIEHLDPAAPKAEGEMEIEGTVEATADANIMVAGLTFTVDAQTIIRSQDGRLLTLADLQIGLPCKVKALLRHGILIALRIEVGELGVEVCPMGIEVRNHMQRDGSEGADAGEQEDEPGELHRDVGWSR